MTERTSELHRSVLDPAPRNSVNVFDDSSFAQAYNDFRPAAQPAPQSGDQIVMDDPFPPGSGSDQVIPAPAATDQIAELPLLDPKLAEQLKGASSVDFATAGENEAAGAQPDYRIVVGEDGKMKLEKVGTGDPLADGKLNIEVPATGDQSLAEAIKQADQNMKEYIREMMAYWKENHPNEPYPGWWTDILNTQPNIPADAKPIPIQDSSSPAAQPETPPEQQQPSDAGGGGGGDRGSGGGGGGYRGGVGPGYSGRDNPAPVEADSSNLLQNVKIVTEVAKQYGVDPELAVATMLQESGGNSRAIGDGGDSVGLFQLNQNGLGAGMSVEERMDPRKNAEIAIKHMAQTQATDQNGDGQVTGGDLAVTSQNPAESVRDEYVANVDGPLKQQAHQLIEQAEKMDDFDPSADTGAWGGYQNGRIPDSALVDVHGFDVAPSISDNLNALLVAAQADGVWSPGQPYATGTYRDYDSQVRLKAEKGDMAATPGKSMHGWGLAIDFNMNNRPLINWLADNAEQFGFKNLPGEPWHYSTNGH